MVAVEVEVADNELVEVLAGYETNVVVRPRSQRWNSVPIRSQSSGRAPFLRSRILVEYWLRSQVLRKSEPASSACSSRLRRRLRHRSLALVRGFPSSMLARR